jgi:hypothetical protein
MKARGDIGFHSWRIGGGSRTPSLPLRLLIVVRPAERLQVSRIEPSLGRDAYRLDMIDHRRDRLPAELSAAAAHGLTPQVLRPQGAPLRIVGTPAIDRARIISLLLDAEGREPLGA